MPETAETIKKLTSELLEKIGIKPDHLEVQDDTEGNFNVSIDSGEDSGVLIGYHGESLNSLQRILSLICYKSLGEWKRIIVDISGYRGERQERLEELAENAAKRVRFLQDPVTLPPMNAFERRVIHMKVAEIPGVWTESTGEERGRRVVIRPGEKPNNSVTQ